jgi:hypothetical protein
MLHYFWRGLVAFLLLYLTHYLHMHRMYTYMLQNKYTLTEKNGSNLKLWSLTPVPLTFEVRTVATAWLKLKKIWSICSASQSLKHNLVTLNPKELLVCQNKLRKLALLTQ